MPDDPSPGEPVESPLFPGRVRTDRLELRAVSPATVDPFEFYERTGPDAPGIEAITEHLPWGPNPTVKAALDYLQDAETALRESEEATYLVVPDESETGSTGGEWAGVCSLDVEWDHRRAEFGVWLREPYWGREYAVETGGAMFGLAFERLDLELVVCVHEDGNDASRATIEKLVDRFGGRHEALLRNQRVGDDGPRDVHRFTTAAAEYVEATDGGRTVDPGDDPVVVRS